MALAYTHYYLLFGAFGMCLAKSNTHANEKTIFGMFIATMFLYASKGYAMPLIISKENLDRMKRGRKAKRVKIGPPKTKAEREMFKRMNELWMKVLFPASEKIKKMIGDLAPPYEIADVIEEALKVAQDEYGIVSDDIIWRWKSAVDEETRAGLFKGLQESIGVDMRAFVDSPEMQIVLSGATIEAANLIKSIPGQYLGMVAQAVADNYVGRELPNGRSLMEHVEKLGGVTKNRARLIARDQTSKLIGKVNQTRQQSIGIKTYKWRTVKDQRVVGNPNGTYPEGNKVHGDHYVMEGKLCRWDDPTLYSVDEGKTWIARTEEMPKTHPGRDIQCRCHAEPIINVNEIIKFTQLL